MPRCFHVEPLPGASFGGLLVLRQSADLNALREDLIRDPDFVQQQLANFDGLIVARHCSEISQHPELLVELSAAFGPAVENYRQTATPARLIHPDAPEILVISNLPPMAFNVPEQPDPPLTANGEIPVQFPHRQGWHTDQSFRRPPPDVSLFYAHQPCPRGQGQTLYANGTAAYAALSEQQKRRIQQLEAIHAIPWTGRSEAAVLAGESPKPLAPHQASQRQPLVRNHPVSRKPALYLCEVEQLDWILGPIANMAPGPGSDAGKLVYELMSHYTQPTFTYVHDWQQGDLVIHDNRNTVHTATWFDSEKQGRVMWRTTVFGNPGAPYANETPSWLPPLGESAIGSLDY